MKSILNKSKSYEKLSPDDTTTDNVINYYNELSKSSPDCINLNIKIAKIKLLSHYGNEHTVLECRDGIDNKLFNRVSFKMNQTRLLYDSNNSVIKQVYG